jgi:hypothetical protein
VFSTVAGFWASIADELSGGSQPSGVKEASTMRNLDLRKLPTDYWKKNGIRYLRQRK